MCDCGGGVSGAQRGNSGGASPVLGSGCWAGAVLEGSNITPVEKESCKTEQECKILERSVLGKSYHGNSRQLRHIFINPGSRTPITVIIRLQHTHYPGQKFTRADGFPSWWAESWGGNASGAGEIHAATGLTLFLK